MHRCMTIRHRARGGVATGVCPVSAYAAAVATLMESKRAVTLATAAAEVAQRAVALAVAELQRLGIPRPVVSVAHRTAPSRSARNPGSVFVRRPHVERDRMDCLQRCTGRPSRALRCCRGSAFL
jgi:hypothetical protein